MREGSLLPLGRFGPFLLGCLLLAVCSCADKRLAQAVAVDGTLDLSDWDFDKDGAVGLKGEWRFVWQELLTPMSKKAFWDTYRGTIRVPSKWPTQRNPNNQEAFLPGHGYGTYVLNVILPKKSTVFDLSMITRSQGTATRWWVADSVTGKILSRTNQGRVGVGPKHSVPSLKNTEMVFQWAESDSVLIWLELSNYHMANGGAWATPTLGPRAGVKESKTAEHTLDVTVFAICLIIGIYHLIIFFLRRDDRSALYFGMFSAVVALRQWCTGRVALDAGIGHSQSGFEVLLALEYMSMPLMVMGCGLFIQSLLPSPAFERFSKAVCVAAGFVLVGLNVLTPATVYSSYLSYYQLHILSGCGGFLIYLFYRSIKGNTLARWILFSFAFAFAGVVNDVLVNRQIIGGTYLGAYGFIGLILMQAVILAARNAVIARERDALNLVTIDALKKSEEAARVKSEFLANMSHELRTPLNALCNIPRALMPKFVEHLCWECHSCHSYFEDDDPPKNRDATTACPECPDAIMKLIPITQYVGDQSEQHYYMKRLDVQAQELFGLVERVLSFSDASTGLKELHLQPVSSDELLESVLSRSIVRANSRDQTIDILKEVTPAELIIDLDKVEQCVDLILDNALKFSDDRQRVWCRIKSRASDQLTVIVRDEGIGIPAEECEKIFTPFYQVASSHTRRYGGAGLGLSLARELLDLHHGSIEVVSSPDVGSTFTLTFRAAPIA